MTYDVCISIKRDQVLPDVFTWLMHQDLAQHEDWDFTKPDYFKDDWDYTFKFVREADATLFALVWA